MCERGSESNIGPCMTVCIGDDFLAVLNTGSFYSLDTHAGFATPDCIRLSRMTAFQDDCHKQSKAQRCGARKLVLARLPLAENLNKQLNDTSSAVTPTQYRLQEKNEKHKIIN